MPAKRLPTSSLRELISLFERAHHLVGDGRGRRVRGLPAWEVTGRSGLSAAELASWTDCAGYAGECPVPWRDEQVLVPLTETDDPSQYEYQCPETFRKKRVAAADVAILAVDEGCFLNGIADLLDIVKATRGGIQVAAVEGMLWKLGQASIANARVDVWIARGLGTSLGEAFKYFQKSDLPDKGLILTTGQALPEFTRSPRAYRVVALGDVLVDDAGSPRIDIDHLHRVLVSAPDQPVEKSLPVQFDKQSGNLVFTTKSPGRWQIKGARQRDVVGYLFEQYCQGRRWVRAAEILTAAYGDRPGRSRRIQDIFSGHPTWREFIASRGRGVYGFNLD